jgi:cell division protein FtsB
MHWISRIGLAALLASAIALCPQQIYRSAGADDLVRLEREHAELTRQNQRVRVEIQLLRDEVNALRRDPEEVARIAREDLNLVRPGEFVFEVTRP